MVLKPRKNNGMWQTANLPSTGEFFVYPGFRNFHQIAWQTEADSLFMGLDFIPPGGQPSQRWEVQGPAKFWVLPVVGGSTLQRYIHITYIIIHLYVPGNRDGGVIYIYIYIFMYAKYVSYMLSSWRIKWPAPKIQLGWKVHLAATKADRTGQGTAVPPNGTSVIVCLPGEASEPHHISCIAEADDMFVGSLMSFSSREIHTKAGLLRILPVSLLLILTQDEPFRQQINTEINLRFRQKAL